MAKHNELGKAGEQLACERLIAEGCAIADRNWRMGHCEIDIVALKGDMVIFAEVKTRSDGDCDPLEAITPAKIRRMAVSAQAYMQHTGRWGNARFDVFGITLPPGGQPHVEHIPDAFIPPLKSYR